MHHEPINSVVFAIDTELCDTFFWPPRLDRTCDLNSSSTVRYGPSADDKTRSLLSTISSLSSQGPHPIHPR